MEVREEQQRIVLDLLVAAAGDPVSYARLREAGVEFPASVIAELELAGLPVRRGPRLAAHSRDPAVSLREAVFAEVAESSSTAPILDPPARRGRRGAALLAAAVTIAGVVIVLAAIGLLMPRGHGSPARAMPPSRAATRRTPKPRPAARRPAPSGLHHASVAAAKRRQARGTSPPPAPVPSASAATLQLSGHTLLADGRYVQATAELRQAMRATGMDVASCTTPAGEACLVYAYALYDLGRSLLLEGRPAEAVAALTARLRIANQQPAVAAELALARAAEKRK